MMPKPPQVLDCRLGGEPGVGAAQHVWDLRVAHREAPHVRLVDDGPAPASGRQAVIAPVELGVDNDALRNRGRVVAGRRARGPHHSRRRAGREGW